MRNPYVTLGVPFAATSDTAAGAFARKAKGLRRTADGTERLRDLTWALNQLQDLIRQPRLALDIYRVPADPGALEPDGSGVLRPSAERMPRGAHSDGHFEVLLRSATEEALHALRQDVAQLATLPIR